jgi:hypothetical protein
MRSRANADSGVFIGTRRIRATAGALAVRRLSAPLAGPGSAG